MYIYIYIINVCDELTVPLDSLGKSTTAAISIAEVHSPSVEIVRSCDEVPPGHGTGSDSTVPLNQLNKKSTIPRSSLVTGHALNDDSELVRDEVPLDLCSSRSLVPLGPLCTRSFVVDDYDSEAEISETNFDMMKGELDMFDKVVDESAPTSAQLFELPMPLRRRGQSDHQNYSENTDEDNVDQLSDDDEMPNSLIDSSSDESDVDEQSQDERDDAPLGRSHNTTAHNSRGEALLPTRIEENAMQVMNEMRLQSQLTSDNDNVIHPQGSIDESRVSTDDGSRGEDLHQDAIGTPHIPKPRFKPSSIMIDIGKDLHLEDYVHCYLSENQASAP